MNRCLPRSLVISAHTALIGALMTIDWTVSRSATAPPLLLVGPPGLLRLNAGAQPDQCGRPVLLVLRNPPLIDQLDRHRIEVIDPAPTLHVDEDQICLPQDGQV